MCVCVTFKCVLARCHLRADPACYYGACSNAWPSAPPPTWQGSISQTNPQLPAGSERGNEAACVTGLFMWPLLDTSHKYTITSLGLSPDICFDVSNLSHWTWDNEYVQWFMDVLLYSTFSYFYGFNLSFSIWMYIKYTHLYFLPLN